MLVVFNNGSCYVLETQTEEFLEFNNFVQEMEQEAKDDFDNTEINC